MMRLADARSIIDILSYAYADITVASGDICNSYNMEEIIPYICSKNKHLVYCTGNHEYYKDGIVSVNDFLDEYHQSIPNFHWLDQGFNPIVEIEGQRFIGDTLWYPRTPTSMHLQDSWSDFAYIRDAEPEIYNHNMFAVEKLGERIQEAAGSKEPARRPVFPEARERGEKGCGKETHCRRSGATAAFHYSVGL